MQTSRFFLTCPKGLESLLVEEVRQLGGAAIKETVAGVSCEGPMALGYTLCLWSRLANKVLLPVVEFPARDAEEIYQEIRRIEWIEHFNADTTFAVDFSGHSATIKNTHFGALKVKDAIVDYFKEEQGERPNVDAKSPQIRINARLYRDKLTVSIDLSGESLHRRGYRLQGAAAPLKENLAAAILLRSGWPAIAERGGALLDPMCGSGTLLLEAAFMVLDIAPGLYRPHWGFDHWLGHIPKVWQRLLQEAELRRDKRAKKPVPEIRGYDADLGAIRAAEQNISRAGLDKVVRVSIKELAEFKPPTHTDVKPGLVVTNPPYGERLGQEHALVHLYRHLGDTLKANFAGWQVGIFTGNPELTQATRMRAEKRYKLFNGPIPCELQIFTIFARSEADTARERSEPAVVALSNGGTMFANRIRKNRKALGPWLEQNQIQCYRLYDADMPEYAVAVDCYGDYWQVTEYKAPKSVDFVKAAERMAEIQAALPVALEVDRKHIVYKERSRQKGGGQYEKLDNRKQFMTVQEGPCKLRVNLHDYLDTGLFLDHRPVRRLLGEWAKGKRFLNLFCYTAVATLHAAHGGARSTTSVDMSATYINWGRENLALNGFSESRHQFVQADVLQWLEQSRDEYDLIFLDPPSFSNSKRMDGDFDVMRDQVWLIDQTMARLSQEGTLVFSNNLRSFQLDPELESSYHVENITARTIDKDFARNPRIHQCWLIRHK